MAWSLWSSHQKRSHNNLGDLQSLCRTYLRTLNSLHDGKVPAERGTPYTECLGHLASKLLDWKGCSPKGKEKTVLFFLCHPLQNRSKLEQIRSNLSFPPIGQAGKNSNASNRLREEHPASQVPSLISTPNLYSEQQPFIPMNILLLIFLVQLRPSQT